MLEESEILSIIGSELSNADHVMDSGETGLEDALDIYLGNPNGTEVEGRSQVTSTDVADAIEWIMPQIMKSFTQNNEVVVFDPIKPGDEQQAELESEYVYDVLMKQNDGFILIHQFVKDALMQRNGIMKVYYNNVEKVKISSYTSIIEQQLQQLLSAEGIELIEKTEYIDKQLTAQKQAQLGQQIQQIQQQLQQGPPQGQQVSPEQIQKMQQQAMGQMQQLQGEMQKPVMLYNVRVSITRTKGQIYIDAVAPEEFRLVSKHNSISLETARFTAHIIQMTASDIMQEYGLSKEEIDEIPTSSGWLDTDYRFNAQNEASDINDSMDPSQRIIEIAENFLTIDINETGYAQLTKITTAGGDTPTRILSKEPVDSMPWVATTAFIMSHKFQGLSMTDRLKEVQEQKTALWRNLFDNIYLQNNQRTAVVENQVNIDDMLVTRPGGIVRVKRLDAIQPLANPSLGQDAFNMMSYLDTVRAGRSGVDPDGGASPGNIGDNVGSIGVNRLMNAKEELVGLIIRVVAETGIKPLCVKIRDLSIQHIDAVSDFKFRGAWHKINPAEWLDRVQCTVRVGTGTGDVTSKLSALREVFIAQEKINAQQGQSLLDNEQVYNSLHDFCKFSGLNGASRYFIDPTSPMGQQKKKHSDQQAEEAKQKNDQLQQSMAKAQLDLAQAELDKVKVSRENNQLKAQNDMAKNQLQTQKQTFEAQLASVKTQLDAYKAADDSGNKLTEMELKKYDINSRNALELTRMEAQAKSDENANYEANKDTTSD